MWLCTRKAIPIIPITKFDSLCSFLHTFVSLLFSLGVRIYAVFGFCDIHHFEDINRLLANDVLVFVNHVAEIVHSR